jgi:hypothetical protein
MHTVSEGQMTVWFAREIHPIRIYELLDISIGGRQDCEDLFATSNRGSGDDQILTCKPFRCGFQWTTESQ